MQAPDELDGDVPEVARDEVEEAAGGEQGERALEGLEERNCAQPLFQVALQR